MTEFLRYPLKTYGSGKDGDRLDDYLYIRVVNYVPPGLESLGGSFRIGSSNNARDAVDALDREEFGTTRQIATIILPMPDKIQDNNGAEWTAGNMNPLAVVAGSSFEAAMSNNLFSSAVGSAGDALRLAGESFANPNSVAGTTAGLVTNALFGQAGINQITSRATGQVFNQNTEFLFNGIQIRPAFQFTFDLTPRSREESERIKKIIRTFKYHMAPKNSAVPGEPSDRQVRRGTGTRQGLFVQAPDVFKLEYRMGNKEHPFLHKFKLCALTQMSVDYTGSGQHSTYADGTPVHMKLSLQFQELSPIFAEDQLEYFENPEKGVGF